MDETQGSWALSEPNHVRKTTQVARFAIAALLLLGTASTARADDSILVPESDTHIKMGGYLQPGFTLAKNSQYNQDDREGFEFANARLTGKATRQVNKEIDTSFHFNFDVNQGNFSVRDVYGTFRYAGGLVALDIGKMKMPFGLALLQSEAYMEMPLSPRTRTLSFGRDLGAQLRGAYQVRDANVRWWAMVANGEGGFRQRRNLDGKYVFAGRMEIAPLGEMGKSEAALTRESLRVTLGANVSWTSSLNNKLGLSDVGAKERRGGIDLRLHWQGLSVRAEAILGKRGDNDAGQGFWRSAGYLQAGYVLPWSWQQIQWEPAIRIEQIDINRNTDGLRGTEYNVDESAVRTYEAGINTYLAGHSAKLSITYRRTDFQEGPVVDRDGGPLIDDSLLFFAQVGWL